MFILLQDDNLTAVVRVSSMLVVNVVGTSAMTVVALLLCLLCAELAITVFISNIVRSPAVQRPLKKRFPGAAGEMASSCVSLRTGDTSFWDLVESVNE